METCAFVRIYEQPPGTIAGHDRDEPCNYSDELRQGEMKFLHSMVRVSDPDVTVAFFQLLGLGERRRIDNEKGRYTLIFLGVPGDEGGEVELTWNWDEKGYDSGRNFGHLAYQVDDIYETCRRLVAGGVTINRPPRDGRMAFIQTPDNISIELLQQGEALPPAEPWASMPNSGEW
jgi:lactoylglutathione lyase